MITISDDTRFDCHVAAMRAIDEALNDALPQHARTHWIRDESLPALLPALDRAIDAALHAANGKEST